jgi:cytochrome c oxidase subunit 1
MGIFAGIYYWVPKMSGRMYHEVWGKVQFWLTFIGMNLTFMPMHLAGMRGMPRRIYTYQPQYALENYIATAGAFILGLSMLIFMINMLGSLARGKKAPVDSWDHAEYNKTLEWTVTSPPPNENFHKIPVIR